MLTLELLIQPIDVGCDIKQVSTWARFEPFGTVLVLRTTTTSQKCEAVPRRARISGSWTFVSLNSRLESNKEETWARGRDVAVVLLDYLPTPPHEFQTFEFPESTKRFVLKVFRRVNKTLQGYLAHKKQPPPLGQSYDPWYGPTVGSYQEGGVSYERGTLVLRSIMAPRARLFVLCVQFWCVSIFDMCVPLLEPLGPPCPTVVTDFVNQIVPISTPDLMLKILYLLFVPKDAF
jgi:hypothetical protein